MAAKKKKKKKEASEKPARSPKAPISKTVSKAALSSVAEFGIKKYEVQQRGLKKAPKKVMVLVTGMGLVKHTMIELTPIQLFNCQLSPDP
eukprot:SAG31_NODE_32_length_32319_cov_28.042681_14_plen_90_part_00